uniref:Uncharacterized protein n=1 Tax=Chaetoceros debilis TaxID=122233 RepID=A0A6S8RH92_9STRA|mmetsp:Transcript_5786/g.8520  ORF Transcript_5786/g.8520 Transcript_5786/m.8520 type:complete len:349 (+) Transcript_5786:1069-2115(+)
MSYFIESDPALTGEINVPQYEIERMPFDIRKIIARRAFMKLRPHTIINLGIGLPEGVAGVAAEEGMLEYVTLSTEPGVFGGLPASASNFGPSYNPSSLIEMNQMFDFYDGGGLNQAYSAQVSKNGDVYVSRISNERLTGPGGFVDISQSTKNIVFLTSLTTDGLIINSSSSTCNGLDIKVEGKIPKFVNEVLEKTFSGEESVRRGQYIQYVTERAVFRRTAKHAVIELIEIAHCVDLQIDILDQMEFVPAISPHLKAMDGRIFKDAKMKVLDELFGSLLDRCTYHELDHTIYIYLFGITLSSEDDVDWYSNLIGEIIQPLYRNKGPIDMVVNYDGFDLSKGLESYYLQ